MAAATAVDSFVRFRTDRPLFDRVKVHSRGKEWRGGGEMTTIFHENSKVRNWIWRKEEKREIHEYWVRPLQTPLSACAPRTGPPAVPEPAANKISEEKSTD